MIYKKRADSFIESTLLKNLPNLYFINRYSL